MHLVPIGISERQVFDAKCEFIEGHRGIKIKSDLTEREWQQLLSGFTRIEGTMPFIIGDLLYYGMGKFTRGKYEEVVELTKKRKQILKNWCSVCGIIPPEERIYDLPFTHYQEVAYKNRETRNRMLSQAEQDRWSSLRLRRELPKAINPDKYGKPIQVDGLAHAPINEQGVVFLFGLLSKQLGFSVDAVQQSFPDCIAKRKVAEGRRSEEWGVVRIEFEFLSSEFRRHGHDASRCDLIICWKHDWPQCPIEVLSLRDWIDENI